jgi:hypothetical protein
VDAVKSKATARPPKPDRSAEFANFQPQARKPAEAAMFVSPMRVSIAEIFGQLAKPTQKTPDRKSQAIRDSARDEQCLVRLPGCPGDYKLTIWSHNRHARAGKGRGIKSLDLNGAYACGVYCDQIYDGARPLPPGVTREQVELAWYHAHAESLVKLRQKGLV